MKILQLKHIENRYTIWDGSTMIYHLEVIQNGSSVLIKMKNAFDEEILTLHVQHSGFKLFRTNKISSMQVKMNQQQGTIIPKEHSYEWSLNGVCYAFVCGELASNDALIMSDHEDTLGYASKEVIVLRHFLYSAELCAFYVYVLASQYKIQLDRDKFARAWMQVQS